MHDRSRRPTPIMLGITELNVGGAERSLVELACRLDPARWRPRVVSLQEIGPLGKKLEQAGIPVESLGMSSAIDFWRGRREWIKSICQHRPAILLTYLFHANILGRFVARATRVPHVSGVRVAEAGARWHLAVDRWTAHAGDRYVAVSRYVSEWTKRNTPQAEVTAIPNGIDMDQIDQAHPIDAGEWGIEPAERVLLWMGRMEKQKDVLTAVRSLVPLAGVLDSTRTKVVLVGDGADRKAAENLAAEAGLRRSVIFVGTTDDPLGWHRRSSGLLMTSRWEGMPNVVLESMGAGRPVISTRFGGVEELVVEGRAGWLADHGQLTESIHAWINDPAEATRRGQRGRERVAKEYSMASVIRRWDEYLSTLIT
jgi:glycosyltransferase involved in cell wall biosynthesis